MRESAFATQNIVSPLTKYHHCVGKLPVETVASIEDVMNNFTAFADPYEELKKRLCRAREVVSPVKKKDGGWWPCGDYCRLNNIFTPDRYPLPNMQNLNSHVAGCKSFSKLDLVKGYHQVPVAATDVPKTAIIAPFGLFEYLYMPFGLKNTSQSFQRLMDRTFATQPCVFVYLDDNLAATAKEHLQVLRQVFQLLKDNILVLNLQKCELFQDSVAFLGHKVHSGGVEPLSGHVGAITTTPSPSMPMELQRFLGKINFYRRFLLAAANILRPLTEALKGNPKVLSWTAEMQAATTAIKAALVAAVPLSHLLPAPQLSLATDASDSHINGVLQQLEAGAWWPLGFYSRKLSETECRYSAFNRELLAASSSIRHFRIMLKGLPFSALDRPQAAPGHPALCHAAVVAQEAAPAGVHC